MANMIDIGQVTFNNLGQVRMLHKNLFPVSYGDQFYSDLLEAEPFAKLAYYNDVCVGVVCCRKEKDQETPEKSKLYMMTLGVLEPYRHLGIGKRMVKHILEQAELSKEISQVYLHVQVTNTAALEFYKKSSFEVIEIEKDYYKNIDPKDAYLLSKTIVAK
ncbi:acyl-CoA N-acyltransferase [Sporodiniella umbellata]|nr:acyl-CoA N-acyltransferase [Sporodiniella umbellata]